MVGARILRVEQRRPDLRFPFPERFAERLTGRDVAALGAEIGEQLPWVHQTPAQRGRQATRAIDRRQVSAVVVSTSVSTGESGSSATTVSVASSTGTSRENTS